MTESYLKEGKRSFGSEWMKNHPRFLEITYAASKRLFALAYPLMNRVAPKQFERFMIWNEKVFKGWIFNCQMCGMCVLHSTGMTCPMTCPKNLRNGPCGGVRANGNCEVIPDLPCIWVQAWERSKQMHIYTDEITIIQPAVDRSLHNTSSWINMAEGKDQIRFPETNDIG